MGNTDYKEKYERALRKYQNGKEKVKEKVKNFSHHIKSSYNAKFEVLFSLAILVHVIDWVFMAFTVTDANILFRILMYFILGLITIFLFKKSGWQVNYVGIIVAAMIPAVIIPVFYESLVAFGISEDVVGIITAIFLAIPYWLAYLIIIENVSYADSVSSDWGIFKKTIITITSPVRLSNFYLYAVLFLLMIGIAAIAVSDAVRDQNFQQGGMDLWSGVTVIENFVGSTYNSISAGVFATINESESLVRQAANRTFGWEYHGTVERNTREQGVFLEPLSTSRNLIETNDLIYIMNIRAESFEERINAQVSCYLENRTNKSQIIVGEVDKPQIQLGRTGIDTFTCTFPNEKLNAGEYRLRVKAKFPFQTWATTIYSFVDRNIYNEIIAGQDDVNDYFNIERYPRLLYTGGPVSLLMANSKLDRDRPAMPIIVDRERETNSLPISTKIENDNSRGKIVNITNVQFRLPEQLNLRSCDTTITKNELDDRFEGRLEGEVYTSHFFGDIKPRDFEEEYSVACALSISGDDVNDFLSPRGDRSFTVNSVANYVYELEYDTSIEIQEALV